MGITSFWDKRVTLLSEEPTVTWKQYPLDDALAV